jgi:hypothetical protein
MGRKKAPYEARLKASNARTSRAVTVFETAIQELDSAAAESVDLVNELDDEIARLAFLQDRAERAAQDSQNIADKMRNLIS